MAKKQFVHATCECIGWVLLLGALAMRTAIAQEPPTIKIGGIYTLTGFLALAGLDNRRGAEMAIEEINAAGGIRSLKGAKLSLVVADGQGRPDVSMSAFERLATQDQVLAVLTMFPSTTEVAMATVAERLKVPQLITISTAPEILGEGKEWAFKMSPNADRAAMDQFMFVEYLGKITGRKIKRVALIGKDTDYGTSQRGAWSKFASAAGMEIVQDLSYSSRAPDLTPIILQLKASDPDVVLQASYLNDSILLRRTADRLSFFKPWIDTGIKKDPAYIKAVGTRLAEYEIAFNQFNFDQQGTLGTQALDSRYQARWGAHMSGYAAAAYQSVLVLVDALERGGEASREALRNALRTTNLRSGDKGMILPMDCIKFQERSERGDLSRGVVAKQRGLNECAALIITQVQNGVWRTVYPERYAPLKPAFPKW